MEFLSCNANDYVNTALQDKVPSSKCT